MYILGTMWLKVYVRYGFIRMVILWFNIWFALDILYDIRKIRFIVAELRIFIHLWKIVQK